MAARIEDYALIGDCEPAALVARDGSIDWLCLPRFDSPACFAALLGTSEHGRWQIAPATKEIRAVRRRYRAGTLVLETDYETETGAATLIDCMPLRTETPTVVRVVEGKRGRVAMSLDLVFRLDYGSLVPWVRRTPDGIWAIGGASAFRLRTPIALRGERLSHGGRLHGRGRATSALHLELVSVVWAGAPRGGIRDGDRSDGAVVETLVRAVHV